MQTKTLVGLSNSEQSTKLLNQCDIAITLILPVSCCMMLQSPSKTFKKWIIAIVCFCFGLVYHLIVLTVSSGCAMGFVSIAILVILLAANVSGISAVVEVRVTSA
ncbi:MAG: hypothetical protein ACJ75B_09595 [Flavisolibacter sp.]